MATTTGAVVKVIASKDQGATWTEPAQVSEVPTAIMPWVTGGAGDRFAITYYASDVPLDSDYVGDWDVMAALIDGAGGELQVATSVLAEGIHQGGLCSRGGGCGPSDRTLLDFFEADVLPDGRALARRPPRGPTVVQRQPFHRPDPGALPARGQRGQPRPQRPHGWIVQQPSWLSGHSPPPPRVARATAAAPTTRAPSAPAITQRPRRPGLRTITLNSSSRRKRSSTVSRTRSSLAVVSESGRPCSSCQRTTHVVFGMPATLPSD
jgi:hypothetical protein